jgi:hypothetical protein
MQPLLRAEETVAMEASAAVAAVMDSKVSPAALAREPGGARFKEWV